MNFKSILVYALVLAIAVTGAEATAQRRAATKTKTRTTTVKSSAGLPNAIGRDTYTTIKRDVTLKYTGSDKSGMTPSYKSYDIDIKWPTDLRLANTGGSGSLAEMDNHKGRVQEIQALLVNALLDEYGTSDIKKEIDNLTAVKKNWKVVSSVPQSAYSFDNELLPQDCEISLKPYLACNKWICFELTNHVEGNGCDGYTKWVTIPRNQAAWNRTEITLISALSPWNYTNNVSSRYGKEISALIKAAAQKDGSYDWIRSGNGIQIPDAMRPERTGISFIFYQIRCGYIDVFVSYAKLKPYLDSSVYNILAGGTGWTK